MKFATLRNHSRDGQLVLVSRDLTRAVTVPAIARTLQQLLDDWQRLSPALHHVYDRLNEHSLADDDALADVFAFDASRCAAPLPRAYQWADGSAYVTHVELVRKARGAEMPHSFWTDPLMYQGGSDSFLGPHDDILVESEEYGIDMEAEVAVITDDVDAAASLDSAANAIRLIMLVNDVSLRNLIPNELAKGFGFFQSKPSSVFSPVAVTPDELGSAWDGGKVHLPLSTYRNNQWLGSPNAGIDMVFDFPTLIAHAAKTRPLCAGSIIGSGTVANSNPAVGSSCLAEVRMREILEKGKPVTDFLKFGERVRIEMLDAEGRSIFGAIDQTVKRLNQGTLLYREQVCD